MNEKNNYGQLVLNLARLAVDLAIENEFYKRSQGEIAGIRQHPDARKKYARFQPPLRKLEIAVSNQETNDRELAKALQRILESIRELLRA